MEDHLLTVEIYEEFFRGEEMSRLVSQIQVEPARPPELNFTSLYSWNSKIAVNLLENPERELATLNLLLNRQVKIRDFAVTPLPLRLTHLPEMTLIRDISNYHIGKLIAFEGIVVQISAPEQEMTQTYFQCLRCGDEVTILQNDQFTQYPERCESCKTRGQFKIIPERCTFKKIQRIVVQENPECVPAGQLPRNFKADLEEDLTESVRPGDRGVGVGIVKARQRRKHDQNPLLDLYLKMNNIILESDEKELNLSTPDEVEEFKRLAAEPNYFQQLWSSVAPDIYGLDAVKKAIILQQCEGNSKMIGARRRRGQTHILIAGDPGVGKTQIMDYAVLLHFNGRRSEGKGSSGVGLTASVVKDTDDRWVLQAGNMVLADRGLIGIDEIEKMNEKDRGHMHPAMEQQVIAINKAGINTTLNTRCSVIATCNPTDSKWNPYKTTVQNLSQLPLSLLNRFDLVFVVKSQNPVEEEMSRAQHILTVHKNPELSGGAISHVKLRKLLSYARSLKPKITPEAEKEILSFYERMLKAELQADSLMITPRQLESLIRLTEASAKAHLRMEASAEDAEIAIELMNESLMQAGIDPSSGQVDVGIFQYGFPSSRHKRLQDLTSHAGVLIGEEAGEKDLKFKLSERWKVDESEVSDVLRIAENDGVIYAPRPGYWRRV